MNAASVSPIQPEVLKAVVETLRAVGVAGNEGDHIFSAQDVNVAPHGIEPELRAAGYVGGSLSVGALVHPRDGIDVLVYDNDRYQSLPQAEQAWEADYNNRWRRSVEARVADWLERLQGLRSQINEWITEAPNLAPLTLVDLAPAMMSEDPMRRFGVEPAEMPVFELRNGAQRVMRFRPKGLWIIGANGRVDLITKSAAPILVDKARFGIPPNDWQLFYPANYNQSTPFDRGAFEKLIGGAMQ